MFTIDFFSLYSLSPLDLVFYSFYFGLLLSSISYFLFFVYSSFVSFIFSFKS